MATTTKCDCICVPREEYELLKAQNKPKKAPSKAKRATTKPKASKPRQKAVQTARIAEPKPIMIEAPKVKTSKAKTKSKDKAKAKPPAKKAAKPKAKVNTVYVVDYPQALPAPKKNIPYKGKVIERREKKVKAIEAPRETIIMKETVMIETPKEEKPKKEHKLAKRAIAGAIIAGKAGATKAIQVSEERKQRKAEKMLAKREKAQAKAKIKTEYSVNYPQALPAPKRDAIPTRSETVPQLPAPKQEYVPNSNIRQLNNCEDKSGLAKKMCMVRNRKKARDY